MLIVKGLLDRICNDYINTEIYMYTHGPVHGLEKDHLRENHMRGLRIARCHMPGHDKDSSASRSAGVSCACDIVPRHCTYSLNITSANSILQERTQHHLDDRLRPSTVAFAGYDQLIHHYGRSIHPSQVAHGSLVRGLRPILLSSGRSPGCAAS